MVPVYLWAFVLTLTGSFVADKCRQRGVFMLGFEGVAIAGLLMLRLSDNPNVQYAGTFFTAGGKYFLQIRNQY